MKYDVYLSGSLRNERMVEYQRKLEAQGFTVFAEWATAGPRADDHWKRYQQALGRTFIEALAAPAAQNTLRFDTENMAQSRTILVVMPAGKSAFTELGLMLGKGKPGFILLEDDKDRWDVMFGLATGLAYSIDEIAPLIREALLNG